MHHIINTVNAPAPIGPYNQAVLAGDTLYVSGQIPLNPETGALELNDIGAATDQVMQNLQAILEAAGMTFSNVVKSTIFLMDMGDFATVNAGYSKYFEEPSAPARETVQVAGLPRGVRIEISVIAVK